MNRAHSLTKRPAGRRPTLGRMPCDTRAQILSAARCVFARRGLDGASVREVAEAAKVNNAMIYYHFKDKIELFRAVLSDSFAAFDRIWEDPVFIRTRTHVSRSRSMSRKWSGSSTQMRNCGGSCPWNSLRAGIISNGSRITCSITDIGTS